LTGVSLVVLLSDARLPILPLEVLKGVLEERGEGMAFDW
jgi:hypothetical protein